VVLTGPILEVLQVGMEGEEEVVVASVMLEVGMVGVVMIIAGPRMAVSRGPGTTEAE
jgi:hypothetical protein